jgi:hypothetical protein
MKELLSRIGRAIARHPFLAFAIAIFGSLLLLTGISLLSGSSTEVQPQDVQEQIEGSTPVEPAPEEAFSEADSIPVDPREQKALEEYLGQAERDGVKEDDLHFDGSQQAIVERREAINNRNGLYSLPFYGRSIFAEYAEVAPDGRFVIKVEYRGSITSAQAEWDGYLRRKRDSGEQYLVLFEPAPR